ncbi:hydantoinase [Xylariaceae sp. FL0255]|nr:hydantoinase [Xylariaceae sp. FL0255]
MTTASKMLRIGVDVGGTNTDGVLLDPSRASEEDRGIVAWHKAPTTADPSDGINDAITSMFKSAAVDRDSIASVTIGTTHFVNAVVERDAARLSRVAVLRLCGPFSQHALPCVDWPQDLRELILGHAALLEGGLEVDGFLISDINEAQIRKECATIREKGINSIVVNGVFSPIDTVERQEERAAEIVRAEIPGCDVVSSKDVASLGFLERENAAILNASILAFARKTLRSFQAPIKRLGLKCPVFITQNDGSIMPATMASKLPIRGFSSGPTNSMRGAAFLLQSKLSEDIMVVDIGGTTTDVGLLLANGFPRQQAAYSDLGGVRMNFPTPDIKSIGSGGGSIVRENNGNLTVGPDSVGYNITKDSRVFGGSILTATDCTILSDPSLIIGDSKLVEGALSDENVSRFRALVKHKLERTIDQMKTFPGDIPVLLVGGGAIIAPDQLKGASRVFKPRWAAVANAIGAATARVSAVIDTVRSTEFETTEQILKQICEEAIEKTASLGAVKATVSIVEYIANQYRFTVRTAGDFDYTRTGLSTDITNELDGEDEPNTAGHGIAISERSTVTEKSNPPGVDDQDINIEGYEPNVSNRVWYISETDLKWISIGCYILGCGGGGSPYATMVRIREMLRRGVVIRVVSPSDLPDDAAVGCGGGAGSPTVSMEKLSGNEMVEAQEELAKVFGVRPSHMISVEIGGMNGLQSMLLGASSLMNIPAVDGDWMGRAYPTKWQTTPVVYGERSCIFAPVAMADGNGNIVIIPKAKSDVAVERICRAALSQMGSGVATADATVTGSECKRWAVENTISQSWRIGRAVSRARAESRVHCVAEEILKECGGSTAGRVLWKGKIVGVQRVLRNGYDFGEVLIEGADITAFDFDNDNSASALRSHDLFTGLVKISFKNENIAAIKVSSRAGDLDSYGQDEEVLGVAPDLITILDAQNGEAIGTPEYRYGLLVIVLGITASPHWTTDRGIELGGPKAFGMDHLAYKPLGTFVKPQSVIDEYNVDL